MNRKILPILVFLNAGPAALAQPSAPGAIPLAGPPPGLSAAGEWKGVEKILGCPGTVRDGVLWMAFPRTDLNVVVQGVPLEPELGLTSWFAFQTLPPAPDAHRTWMTGELVLLDQEVPKVLAELARRKGLEVTALQHPFLMESPGLETLRVTGRGARTRLAEVLKDLLAVTGSPLGPSGPSEPPTVPRQNPGQDWSAVESVLGPGRIEGRVWEVDFPSAPSRSQEGAEIPSPERDSVIRFQKNRDQAAAAGQLALTGDQVKEVAGLLAAHRMTVTAIGGPIGEGPSRFFFVHFWALGDPAEIAEGFKAALDAAKPSP